MRKSTEIYKELEELQEILKKACSMDGAIYALDLQFFADRQHDLKQELRIALSVENCQ